MTNTAAIKLLNGATAPGDGPVVDLTYPYIAASWQIEYPGGVPASLSGTIEGLLDGSTWGTLATFTQATVGGTITAFTYPLCVRQVKANISAISGGSVSVYLAARG